MSYSFPSKDQLQASSLSKYQDLLAIACRSHVQIHKITANDGISADIATYQLTKQRADNNFTVTDVQFNFADPNHFAASATNGAIVIYNLEKESNLKKQPIISIEQTNRAVNRISWSHFDSNILASANQDSSVKLYDKRINPDNCCLANINPRSDACRDIQFSPLEEHFFAGVFENGNLLVWDSRKCDNPYMKITGAHTSCCLAVSWSLCNKSLIATGGRDKNVKIWDITRSQGNTHENHPNEIYEENRPKEGVLRPIHILHTPYGVSRLAWRPPVAHGSISSSSSSSSSLQLACCSVDRPDISVWDIRSPHLPACILKGHSDICTGISWIDSIVSSSSKDSSLNADRSSKFLNVNQHIASIQKDGKILIQDLRNGYFPRQHIPSSIVTVSSRGHLAYQRSNIFRGDPLHLFVSTDSGSDDIDRLSKKLTQVGSLFRENKQLFGLNLSDRIIDEKVQNDYSEYMDTYAEQKASSEIIKHPKVSLPQKDVIRRPSYPGISSRIQLKSNKQIQKDISNVTINSSSSIIDPSKNYHANNSSDIPGDKASLPIGQVFVGLANIRTFSSANEISHGLKGGGAEGGAFDPAIISLLAKNYVLGNEETQIEMNKFEEELNFFKDDYFDSVETDISESLVRAKSACLNNLHVARSVGLKEHALYWEALLNLMPALIESNHHNESKNIFSLTPDFPIYLATDLVASQLKEFLDKGDCQHFVAFSEVLRNCQLISVVLSSSPEITSLKQREAYMMYLDTLKKLELFNEANVILKFSNDEYLSQLNRASTLLHINCAKCGKEISDGTTVSTEPNSSGSWCNKCKIAVGLCMFCYRLVSGVYIWCPVCSHGGHKECLKKWFSSYSTCPSGCGHPCF